MMHLAMGSVVAIWLRPAARVVPRGVAVVRAIAGVGLEGDHAGGGRRQVTLLDRSAWRAVCAELRAELDPAARRANLLLEGIDLRASRGRRLRCGGATLLLHGELRPCELMNAAHAGLHAALQVDGRGGAFAAVLASGVIHAGDPAEWLDA